jgi:antirestriction protein ArdC
MSGNAKVQEYITKKVIGLMEKGDLKWLKDWTLGFGINYVSKKEYSGINALMINISLKVKEYEHNQWLTFNQIKKLDGTLKKGSKATPVVFFSIKEVCSCGSTDCEQYKKKAEGHKAKRIRLLRYYNVFNIDDTDLEPIEMNREILPIPEVEKRIGAYWNLKKITIGEPAYNPSMDKIYMPKISNFKGQDGYYSALTHELIHSTGHESRLNRKGITKHKDKETYAYEELVAELGSAFLCADLRIDKSIERTGAYIKSWLNALKNDKSFIFKASAEAKKAQEYISSLYSKDEYEAENKEELK